MGLSEIYKIIGTLLLCATGGGVAIAYVRYERRKLMVLDAFISLILYIKGQIDCCCMPIGEILSSADKSVLSECMGVGCPDFEKIVKNCKYLLEREPYRLLTSFSVELGNLYRDEQMRRCDYYIQQLTQLRQRQYDRMPQKIRLCSTLAVCAAAGLAVLLW